MSFWDNWRKKHGAARGVALVSAGSGEPDPAGIAELLSECDLLRSRAQYAGLELDDTADSLAALDQLKPRWRDDPEELPWLGNDAGLYLGTVIVRTVPGALWQVWPNGHPIVQLPSGRELDVVAMGHEWAEQGAPELSQVYGEAAEG